MTGTVNATLAPALRFANAAPVSRDLDVILVVAIICYNVDGGHASVARICNINRFAAVVDCSQKPNPTDPVQENPDVADTVTGVVLVEVAIIISVCVADTNLIVTLTI